MLGIPDPMVVLAYVLCIASTLVCVVYAWRNWNRGDESEEQDDVKWAKKREEGRRGTLRYQKKRRCSGSSSATRRPVPRSASCRRNVFAAKQPSTPPGMHELFEDSPIEGTDGGRSNISSPVSRLIPAFIQ